MDREKVRERTKVGVDARILKGKEEDVTDKSSFSPFFECASLS